MNEVKHSSSKIFINSSNTKDWATSTTNTTLNLQIQPFILDGYDTSHFIIGLEQLSIPLSVYAVNSQNNVLQINGYTLVLSTGNYTITDLKDHLNTLNTRFVFSYSSTKNLMTLVSTDSANLTSIVIGSLTTAQKILGVVTGTKTGLTYTFENMVNLTFTSGIIVQLNNISTTNRDTVNKGSGSNLLARVPINCAPFRILNYFNGNPFYSVLTVRYINSISISLLNDDLSPLRLEGNPVWYAVLRVDYADKVSMQKDKSAYEDAKQAEQSKVVTIKSNIVAPPLFR